MSAAIPKMIDSPSIDSAAVVRLECILTFSHFDFSAAPQRKTR
jgi:hypothetical protein